MRVGHNRPASTCGCIILRNSGVNGVVMCGRGISMCGNCQILHHFEIYILSLAAVNLIFCSVVLIT